MVEERPAAQPVPDLMTALKASLEQAQSSGGEAAKKPARSSSAANGDGKAKPKSKSGERKRSTAKTKS